MGNWSLSIVDIGGAVLLVNFLLALGAAGLLFALFRGGRALARQQEGRFVDGINGLFVGLVSAAPLYWIGAELARGEWISRQWYAALMGPAAALLGGGGLAAVGGLASMLYSRRVRRRSLSWCGIAALGVIAALLVAVNALVLTNQYARFHLLVYGLAVLFASLFGLTATHDAIRRLRFRWKLGFGIAGVGLACGVMVATWSLPSGARWALSAASPLTAKVVNGLLPRPSRQYLAKTLATLEMEREQRAPASPGRPSIGDD